MDDTPMKKMLYVDDSLSNFEDIKAGMEEMFKIRYASNAKQAIESIEYDHYDVFLLDYYMPFIDGKELKEQIITHHRYQQQPIFFITYDTSIDVIEKLLKTEAEDVFDRSKTPKEIAMRMKARLDKMHNSTIMHTVCFGPLSIRTDELTLLYNHTVIDLTLIEYKMIYNLMIQQGHYLNRDDFIKKVWRNTKVESGTVNTHITNLRKKLQAYPIQISSCRKEGLKLDVN